MKDKVNDNDILREKSGNIADSDNLTSFLYQLMRDEMVPGKVEKIIRNICDEEPERLYSNGWLMQYAQYLSNKLLEKK